MIYRPCIYRILEDSIIVEFEDFVESKSREVLFYSVYDFSKTSPYVLICKTTKDNLNKNYILLSEPGSTIEVNQGDSNEIHKAIVNNLDLIKSKILKNFGYVWV